MQTVAVSRPLYEILHYHRAPVTKRERLLRSIQQNPGRTVREWIALAPELECSASSIRSGLNSLKLASAIAICLMVRDGERTGPFCFAINQLEGVTVTAVLR